MIAATGNPGKVKEIKEIFSDYLVFSLKDINASIEVEENANSFYGNALKKAQETYNLLKEPVIADDSGLCITGLDDFPGVETHRFLGEDATDEDRNTCLIEKTNAISDRSAKVVCVIVYYDGENTLVGEGTLDGKISTTRRGENGFGFDEIFELPDGRTLAELTSEEKNNISARRKALENLKEKLDNLHNNPVISQKK